MHTYHTKKGGRVYAKQCGVRCGPVSPSKFECKGTSGLNPRTMRQRIPTTMTMAMTGCRYGVPLPSSHGPSIKRPRGVHKSRGSTSSGVTRRLRHVVAFGPVPAGDLQVAVSLLPSCTLLTALYPVLRALSSLLSAPCPLLSALCSLLPAPCALHLGLLHASCGVMGT